MTNVKRNGLDQKVLDSVLPLLAELDTARALTATILLRNHEYTQLTDLWADPAHYDSAVKHAKSAAASDLLRKYPGLPTGIDLEEAAIESFWDSERRCAKTNVRLRDFTEGCAVNHEHALPEIHLVVDHMRTFVREVVGRLPESLVPKLGPGATVSDGSKLATVPDKFSSIPTMTSGFSCMVPVWDHTAWARAHYRRQHARLSTPPRVVRGNVFFTVPKDSKKHRGAAKGPSLNVAYQLATGTALRDCLKKVGVDLQTGQEHHQILAREGSVNDTLVTIDLSSASDTVAYQLVKLAFPSLWFELLETLREPMTQVKGKWVLLNKYSAMGNGFTFELETLLFLAICHAAAMLHGESGHNLLAMGEMSVYGDDIIVPKRIAATTISLLKFFGFTPNKRKTFLTGEFRESCGGDYFHGHEVTPFRLTDEITEPHQWIGFANGITKLGRRLNRDFGCSIDYGRIRSRILSNLPVHIRKLTGPEWLGDVVINDESDAWRSRLQLHRDDPQTLVLDVWGPIHQVVGWEHFYYDVVLASALYGSGTEGVSPRGVSGYKRKRVGQPAFAWADSSPMKGSLLNTIERVTKIKSSFISTASSRAPSRAIDTDLLTGDQLAYAIDWNNAVKHHVSVDGTSSRIWGDRLKPEIFSALFVE